MPKRCNYIGLVDANDLALFVPVRANTIRNLSRKGEFPSPIKVGQRYFWRRTEVNEWLAERGLPLMPDPEVGG